MIWQINQKRNSCNLSNNKDHIAIGTTRTYGQQNDCGASLEDHQDFPT